MVLLEGQARMVSVVGPLGWMVEVVLREHDHHNLGGMEVVLEGQLGRIAAWLEEIWRYKSVGQVVHMVAFVVVEEEEDHMMLPALDLFLHVWEARVLRKRGSILKTGEPFWIMVSYTQNPLSHLNCSKTNDISIARAIYMYQAQIPEELGFAKGDILAVLKLQDDGWWEAEIVGRPGARGLVPSNYLQVVDR
jgi:hypothetical protein